MSLSAAAAWQRARAGWASLLILATPALAQTAPISIEALTGAPFPSDLTGAPKGDQAAWVFDASGVRNVWIAGASGAPARAITRFSADDGSDIGDLAWSPDATHLAFTRAPTLEDNSPANTGNAPEGAWPQEVWSVATDGSGLHKVGVGHDAIWSPDGAWLAYVDKTRILFARTTGEGPTPPAINDRGGVGALTWSPDGKRLAFISRRGGHAIVGVFDMAARTLTWLAPSLDNDSSPVFSPDGARVAFIRTAAEKRAPFITRRSGEPWSIWVAEVASGGGRRVWVSDPGAGSVFARTLVDQNLLWAAGDRLVFPWEKTGWRHLYSVPVAGGPASALTSGPFEVSTLALSADRRRVVYSSNQDDIDRSHVWSVGLAGERPTRLSKNAGIDIYPALGARGALFALQSDATRPLRPVVLAGSQWRPLAPETTPADFPSAQLVTPQSVTFAATDGGVVHGQLFVPRGTAEARPAILFFHGGPQRQMLLGFHPMGAYNLMYAQNQSLTAQGYIVLSVNYRGGLGYGLDYREANAFGPDGGSELNDLMGAVAFLKARADVDPRRFGIYGASYGGLMTALGLARASNDIAAGVDYAGVYNWSTMLAQTGTPPADAAAAQLAVASSPIATIERWKSPVLIVQADDDRNVPAAQASELIIDLRRHGIPHEAIMLPNEVHDMTRHADWMTLFHATDSFFRRRLAPQ